MLTKHVLPSRLRAPLDFLFLVFGIVGATLSLCIGVTAVVHYADQEKLIFDDVRGGAIGISASRSHGANSLYNYSGYSDLTIRDGKECDLAQFRCLEHDTPRPGFTTGYPTRQRSRGPFDRGSYTLPAGTISGPFDPPTR